MTYTAPKSGIYKISADTCGDLGPLDKVVFSIYARREVGKEQNPYRKFWQFWKPKEVPVYEYDLVEEVDSVTEDILLHEDLSVFMEFRR